MALGGGLDNAQNMDEKKYRLATAVRFQWPRLRGKNPVNGYLGTKEVNDEPVYESA
jgi:hypothetical protein